jgi:hypothetical protein
MVKSGFDEQKQGPNLNFQGGRKRLDDSKAQQDTEKKPEPFGGGMVVNHSAAAWAIG